MAKPSWIRDFISVQLINQRGEILSDPLWSTSTFLLEEQLVSSSILARLHEIPLYSTEIDC